MGDLSKVLKLIFVSIEYTPREETAGFLFYFRPAFNQMAVFSLTIIFNSSKVIVRIKEYYLFGELLNVKFEAIRSLKLIFVSVFGWTRLFYANKERQYTLSRENFSVVLKILVPIVESLSRELSTESMF